jgi:hypothetical protein
MQLKDIFSLLSDRKWGYFAYLSEICECVRYTLSRTQQNIWNEAEKRITFASSKGHKPYRQAVRQQRKKIIVLIIKKGKEQ